MSWRQVYAYLAFAQNCRPLPSAECLLVHWNFSLFHESQTAEDIQCDLFSPARIGVAGRWLQVYGKEGEPTAFFQVSYKPVGVSGNNRRSAGFAAKLVGLSLF